MFDLLVEFVVDERNEERQDPARRRFLSKLLADLSPHREGFGSLPHEERMRLLRDIRQSMDEEFADDPVVEHVSACIDELERIGELRPSGAHAGRGHR